MRVSLEWLNDYVDIEGLAPKDIAEALTNAGLEVESIETVGGEFSGVVVGKVVQVEQHPNADRLRLVKVDLGALGQNQVVCGAPNVAQDMRIAYAQIGAKVISRKEGTLFELKPVAIRGVESTGMICSLGELGLEEQFTFEEDGIWPLNELATDADLGRDLKEVLKLQADTVLDVTPNANRGDQMSMIGVAREVAALFKRRLKLKEPPNAQSGQTSPYTVRLEDPSACHYYGGAILDKVTIGESPDWMRQRLLAAGIRAISNVVDITNYVMLESGQPLHAFDIQKLGPAGTIGVRHARPGEQFRSLDGVERPLSEPSVVVTFNDRPVALGGVMGGEETEISDTTGQVFLEAAYFPPASNRRSARSIGLRTESSARFERGVDPGSCRVAFNRAIELLQQLAGATLVSIAEDDHRQLQTPEVPLSLDRMERILGVAIPQADVELSLSSLGFILKPGPEANSFSARVPSFRSNDVHREIDLIEEVIRIHGYDAIPYTLPSETAAPLKSLRLRSLSRTRELLTASGLSEVTTLSLIGDALLRQTGFTQDPETTVRVTNTHSQDHTFLRQSLIPNLLETAKHNQDQGNDDLWLFELGRTYIKRRPPAEKESGVDELLHLSGLVMNSPRKGVWHQHLETDFYTLKGILENLLGQFNLAQQCRWLPEAAILALHPGQSAKVKLGKTELGFVGRLHPVLQEELKFKHPVYIFELNFEVLYQALQKKADAVTVQAISSFPSVKRDFAFLVPDTVTHQQVMAALAQAQEPLLHDVQLFDEYRGAKLGEGNRSLAYRLTLQSPAGTLTESEIDTAVDKLKRQLTNQLPVSFR